MSQARRRRLIVDGFQYRLLILNWVYFVALVLVFAGAVFLPIAIRVQSDDISFEEKRQLAEAFLSLHAHLWPAVFLLLFLLTVHSVFVSHRVAGPLYRVRKVLERVGGGDLTVRLNLRKNDYLVREADSINQMVSSLRDKMVALKTCCAGLLAAADEVEAGLKVGAAAGAREQLSRLREEARRLEGALAQLRTDPASPPAAARPVVESSTERATPDAAPVTVVSRDT